jgi:hypothetical protein
MVHLHYTVEAILVAGKLPKVAAPCEGHSDVPGGSGISADGFKGREWRRRPVRRARQWTGAPHVQGIHPECPSRERMFLSGTGSGSATLPGASMANKEIAGPMEISESAVKNTLQQWFAKTNVRTRTQSVRVALEQYGDLL